MRGRRSFHVLVLATTTALAACAAEVPPPVTATPEPPVTAAPATTAPPVETAAVEPPKAPEQAKPPTPAKVKLVGKFVQDFAGELKESAEAAAKKAAGPKDKEGKKYQAAIDKAAAAAAQVTLENTAATIVWSVKGKAAHTVGFEIADKADDPSSVTLKVTKEDGKEPRKAREVTIAFTDDDTFTIKDPFAKDSKKAATLVFKRAAVSGG